MKVGFVGAGKMAEAMISAIISARVARPHQLFASDIDAERRNDLKTRYGINMYAGNKSVPEMAGTVFLSVKPQEIEAVLTEIAPCVTRKHLIISIAAGRSLSAIEALLPGARAIRVMPNLACQVCQSMSVFTAGTAVTAADRNAVEQLLGTFGKVMELPESSFDVVTALSGSGPAFFAYFMDRMVDAAVGGGLQREQAVTLAAQTMLGTACLLVNREMDPRELVRSVSSPKGTTVEGIRVLENSALAKIVEDMIGAAMRRSRELSQ